MKVFIVLFAMCCSLGAFAQQLKPIENAKSNPVITLDKQGNQVCPKKVKAVELPKETPKRRRHKRSVKCGRYMGCPGFY